MEESELITGDIDFSQLEDSNMEEVKSSGNEKNKTDISVENLVVEKPKEDKNVTSEDQEDQEDSLLREIEWQLEKTGDEISKNNDLCIEKLSDKEEDQLLKSTSDDEENMSGKSNKPVDDIDGKCEIRHDENTAESIIEDNEPDVQNSINENKENRLNETEEINTEVEDNEINKNKEIILSETTEEKVVESGKDKLIENNDNRSIVNKEDKLNENEGNEKLIESSDVNVNRHKENEENVLENKENELIEREEIKASQSKVDEVSENETNENGENSEDGNENISEFDSKKLEEQIALNSVFLKEEIDLDPVGDEVFENDDDYANMENEDIEMIYEEHADRSDDSMETDNITIQEQSEHDGDSNDGFVNSSNDMNQEQSASGGNSSTKTTNETNQEKNNTGGDSSDSFAIDKRLMTEQDDSDDRIIIEDCLNEMKRNSGRSLNFIREGAAEIFITSPKGVFYNPVQEFNRDLR